MMLSAPEPGATHSLTLRTSYSTSPRAQPPPGRSPQRTGAIRCPGSFYAPALPLQDLAYSYRVWITLIKLLYARLRYLEIHPEIHPLSKYAVGCYMRHSGFPRRTLLRLSKNYRARAKRLSIRRVIAT